MKAYVYRYYGHRGYRTYRRHRRVMRVWWIGLVVLLVVALLAAAVLVYSQRKNRVNFARSDDAAFGIATGGALAYENAAQITQYMQHIKELGVTWVRFDIDWSDVQRGGKTSYDWARYDRLVSAAAHNGLHVLGIVTYTPAWARAADCATYTCPPASPADFAAFGAAAAARYAPLGVHDWEIWNEPNQTSPAFPATTYARLLALSSMQIKTADTSAQIIVGGLARPHGNSKVTPAAAYLQSIYQTVSTATFDAVAVHPYTFPDLPNDGNVFATAITNVRGVMTQYGDSTKPIWITEFGSPTGGIEAATPAALHDYTRSAEASQASMVNQALQTYARLANMGPFFWFNYQDAVSSGGQTRPANADSYFGLVRDDGSKKPAYDRFKVAVHSITGQ